MPVTVDQLLSRTNLLWRAGHRHAPPRPGLSTGYESLNGVLRDAGWPRGALVELLLAQAGIGEMQLLLPLLAALGARGLYQLWIDPPFDAFAPGLSLQGVDLTRLVIVRPADHNQRLWAFEQALRSPGCGAVVCWPGADKSRYAALRKLQVAAAERSCVGFIFGPLRNADLSSPAALRLRLSAIPAGLVVEVLKQRGGWAGPCVTLETPLPLRRQLPLRECPAVVSASRFSMPSRLVPPQPQPQAGISLTQERWQ